MLIRILRTAVVACLLAAFSSAQISNNKDIHGANNVGRILYSFKGFPTDGQSPFTGLIADKFGALYGVTDQGGLGVGTVFKLSPPSIPGGLWQETVLYEFGSTNYPTEGSNPQASLVFDKKGNLYGTTTYGGILSFGTVFELSPPQNEGDPWIETQLYVFNGEYDGNYPDSPLQFDDQGNLYGTTFDSQGYFGGGGGGLVFELTPPSNGSGPWAENVLYIVNNFPSGAFAIDHQGRIYGTTQDAGTGAGSVYQLVPPTSQGGAWTKNDLYIFAGGVDGYRPYGGLVVGRGGALYGTTYEGGFTLCTYGCGTVFQLMPPKVAGDPWKETLIHIFTGGADGTTPYGSVVADRAGTLYGTTTDGGSYGMGTVYKLMPPTSPNGVWQETILHGFSGGEDGANPLFGNLTLWGGAVYGTTEFGGSADQGTVFAYKQ